MRLELAWWELVGDDPSVDALLANPSLHAARREWSLVPNLVTKLWLSAGAPARWGALMIWNGDKPPLAQLPRNISAEIIGRPPDQRLSFDVLDPELQNLDQQPCTRTR